MQILTTFVRLEKKENIWGFSEIAHISFHFNSYVALLVIVFWLDSCPKITKGPIKLSCLKSENL